MKIGYHISSVKTKVTIAAATLFLILSADWCSPGPGLHQAAVALGGYGSIVKIRPSIWGFFVQLIGWDVRGLGTLSLVAGLICTTLYSVIVGDLIRYALGLAKLKCVPGTHRYDGITSSVSVLAGASFLFTPGLLMAATRVDPLLIALSLILGALVILVRTCLFSPYSILLCLTRKKWRVLSAVALLATGSWEFLVMGHLAILDSLRTFAWFALVSFFPMLAFLNLIRSRKIIKPSSMKLFLLVWLMLIFFSGMKAVTLTRRGREVSRLVEQILGDAHGCDAILSEGYLDDMLFFTRPRGLHLISLVRDNDDKYRRDLSVWVAENGLDNLVWAAEIGPRTLVDEWRRADPEGFARRVRTSASYFPTLQKWREAYELSRKISPVEPLGAYMRKLVTACGNDLGCRFLDEGDARAAWAVFWEILKKVDSGNCTAIANLYAMQKRGYLALSSERQELDRLNQRVVAQHRTARRLLWEAYTGGRLYLNVKNDRGLIASMVPNVTQLSDREKEFVETVSKAPNSSMSAEKAREAIDVGVKTRLVRLDRIGPQLLRLDIALGDWARAESDAKAILDINARQSVAHGVLGLVKCRVGDYVTAEYHLRTALKADRTNTAALNDLAVLMTRVGRFDEAMRFAAAAVDKKPNDWNFRETLALAQIRGWNPQEGERTLQKALQLAETYGIHRGDVARFEIDFAWLCVARRDKAALAVAIASLERRQDLKPSEIKELADLKDFK